MAGQLFCFPCMPVNKVEALYVASGYSLCAECAAEVLDNPRTTLEVVTLLGALADAHDVAN